MTDLLALTVREPWASPIADGLKPTENRSQGFRKTYTGPVLIHAGKGYSWPGSLDDRILELHGGQPLPERFHLGAVIAVGEISDVHPASGCCGPWGEETYAPANPETRSPGRVTHLSIEHAVRIRPIPARGALGLWRPDPDLVLEVCYALAEIITLEDPHAAETLAERGDFRTLWSVARS